MYVLYYHCLISIGFAQKKAICIVSDKHACKLNTQSRNGEPLNIKKGNPLLFSSRRGILGLNL